jgi:tetratricopeptide (TPR) repeat protein
LRELAQILYDQKQYDRSLDYSQKLLEADPKDGKALYQAGLTFIKLGKKDRGQNMCDKAIELDPSLAGKKTTIGSKDDFGL